MGEYKGGNSNSTILRQRLPIIILAKAKQSAFGAMHYALPHSGAPAAAELMQCVLAAQSVQIGRGPSTLMLSTVHHCAAGSHV
jgi:hypothetical protein